MYVHTHKHTDTHYSFTFPLTILRLSHTLLLPDLSSFLSHFHLFHLTPSLCRYFRSSAPSPLFIIHYIHLYPHLSLSVLFPHTLRKLATFSFPPPIHLFPLSCIFEVHSSTPSLCYLAFLQLLPPTLYNAG